MDEHALRRLPSKPSALIRLALVDLEKCEKSKEYDINMVTWHSPRYGRCEVCLAGAVMAQTLGLSPNQHAEKVLFSVPIGPLFALNDFRVGDIRQGCNRLGIETHLTARVMPEYHLDRQAFKDALQVLAQDFEAEGN